MSQNLFPPLSNGPVQNESTPVDEGNQAQSVVTNQVKNIYTLKSLLKYLFNLWMYVLLDGDFWRIQFLMLYFRLLRNGE